MSADDAVGGFQLLSEYSSSNCPWFVNHNAPFSSEDGFVAHSTITMNSYQCNDGYVTTVYGDQAGLANAAVEGDAKDLVNSVTSASQVGLYAYEENGRTCGPNGESSFRQGTVIVFVQPSKTVTITALEVNPNTTYMFTASIFEKCFFQLNTMSTIPPSTAASPSALATGPVEAPTTTVETETEGEDEEEPSLEPSAESMTPSPSMLPSQSPTPSPSKTNGTFTNPSNGAPLDEADGSGAACFPADAMVELADGRHILMSHLQIGDVVRVGANVFSPVFMFSHREPPYAHRQAFVRLTTASGRAVELTAGHYIYVNGRPAAAAHVRVGDHLFTEDHMSSDAVTSIAVVQKRGLYNPHTTQGDVMVNGLLTTTFTTAVDLRAAHALLLPFRLLYTMFGWSSSVLNHGADTLVRHLPKGVPVL